MEEIKKEKKLTPKEIRIAKKRADEEMAKLSISKGDPNLYGDSPLIQSTATTSRQWKEYVLYLMINE